MEDVVRETERPMTDIFAELELWVKSWKAKKATAIPAWRYQVKITPSLRFNRKTPELLHVPGFTGIRIHKGNTSADTEGCIILGLDKVSKDFVGRSEIACNALMAKLQAAENSGEENWIEIRNP
jgi:Steigviridae/Suoliviridae L,D-carboxypeptidase/transpeptidase